MSIVTVKNKYQIVIPQNIREQVSVVVGDFLEASVNKGTIVFKPKTLIDRGIEKGREEFKKGRSFGPFATHTEFLASLRKHSKRIVKKKI